MSTRRDLVWFKKEFPLSALTASTFRTFAIEANDTNLLWPTGGIAHDTHKSLRGNIEQIIVHSEAQITGVATDVIFFSKGTAGASLASEAYIDHESFVTTDFIAHNTTVSVASANGLSIPYFDADSSKKFHLGITYATGLGAATQLSISLAWRADRGEP